MHAHTANHDFGLNQQEYSSKDRDVSFTAIALTLDILQVQIQTNEGPHFAKVTL